MAIGVKMVQIANQKPKLTNAHVELDHWRTSAQNRLANAKTN
jgi:hypothetical protein